MPFALDPISLILFVISLLVGCIIPAWIIIENARWKRVSTRSTYVLPTDESALAFTTELQGVDTGFFLVPDVPVVWIWRTDKLDFEHLKLGLQRTLNRIPIAAGKLVIGSEKLEITMKGSRGCYIRHQLRETEAMPSSSAPSSAWSKYGIFDTLIPAEPFDRPFLCATLTHFKTGSCLYVNFSHALMDGAAMSMFMQVWSFETNAVASRDSASTTTQEPPKDVDCDHHFRGTTVKLDKDDESRYMSFFQAIQFIRAIAWNYYTQQVVDFEFNSDTWGKIKDQVHQGLDKGQWVSSYEAIMGLVLSCIGAARTQNGHTKTDVRAIVNIRGRSSLFSPRYFGNALGMHEFTVGSTAASSEVARDLHDTLRDALKAVTPLEKAVLIPQHFETHRPTPVIGRLFGGRLDYVQRARYVLGWERSSVSDSYIINSWVGYPWLEVQFATGKDADEMRVPPAFRSPRQSFVCPIAKDKYQLRVSLPRNEINTFRSALKKSGFDFRETENQNAVWYFPLINLDFLSSCVYSARLNSTRLYHRAAKAMSKSTRGNRDRLPSVGTEASIF